MKGKERGRFMMQFADALWRESLNYLTLKEGGGYEPEQPLPLLRLLPWGVSGGHTILSAYYKRYGFVWLGSVREWMLVCWSAHHILRRPPLLPQVQ